MLINSILENVYTNFAFLPFQFHLRRGLCGTERWAGKTCIVPTRTASLKVFTDNKIYYLVHVLARLIGCD